MPANGWYNLAGNADNVTDAGAVWGWADGSGNHYGNTVNAQSSRKACSFGPTVNNFGTWGQLICRDKTDRPTGSSQATGLNGQMPNNPAPGNSNWVQGHLINSDLGGYGSLAHNLTPISHNLNHAMRGHEAAVRVLLNGDGASTIRFNPNNLQNCAVIYRVHATPPPAGPNPNPLNPHPFANVPSGVVMSLGIVIGGALQSQADFDQHFTNIQNGLANVVKWFSNGYYSNGTPEKTHVPKLRELIGGHLICY